MDDEQNKMIDFMTGPEEEFEEKMKNMSPEDMAAWAQSVYDAISDNPDKFPNFPPAVLETIGGPGRQNGPR